MKDNGKATYETRKRYDRTALIYDLMEGLIERSRYSSWRRLLWSKVEGENILEIGVGTGKNFSCYPKDAGITAIDFSEKMLTRAQRKSGRENISVNLLRMDVQDMEFEDNTFDTVIGSFVFCSVPDPVRGLKEVKRVVKPGGKVVLMNAENNVGFGNVEFVETPLKREATLVQQGAHAAVGEQRPLVQTRQAAPDGGHRRLDREA